MRDQWIEWLQDKQRHFFYGITIVVATFFIAFQLFGKFHKPVSNQSLAVNQAFEKWVTQGDAFEKLETALRKNPELETKFGAMVADKFIVQNDGDKAQPFAENVFQRAFKQTPEHTAFAEGSLLIAKGNLQEALTRAVSLNDQLDHQTILFGFNLIRIASLYRALETPEKELLALEDLEQFMQSNGKATSVLIDCFHEGDVTLTDYIHERKARVAVH